MRRTSARSTTVLSFFLVMVGACTAASSRPALAGTAWARRVGGAGSNDAGDAGTLRGKTDR
jgi:hypothetical protein